MRLHDYVIALYILLSANDKKVESNSIEHQKLLLKKYAENMEIPNIKLLGGKPKQLREILVL